MHMIRQGDKYRGRWRYDDMNKVWVGNPVRSATVKDMLEACINKDGEGERRHSQTTSIEDMQKLHKSYLKNCPTSSDEPLEAEDVKKRATYLLFNALSTSAFIIWMRCESLTFIGFGMP